MTERAAVAEGEDPLRRRAAMRRRQWLLLQWPLQRTEEGEEGCAGEQVGRTAPRSQTPPHLALRHRRRLAQQQRRVVQQSPLPLRSLRPPPDKLLPTPPRQTLPPPLPTLLVAAWALRWGPPEGWRAAPPLRRCETEWNGVPLPQPAAEPSPLPQLLPQRRAPPRPQRWEGQPRVFTLASSTSTLCATRTGLTLVRRHALTAITPS